MIGWLLLVPLAAAAPPDLSGTWQVELTLVSATDLPVIGAVRSTTESVLWATVTGDRVSWSTCSVRIRGATNRARTVVPQAFVRSVPVRAGAMDLVQGPAGWMFTLDMGRFDLGFQGPRVPDDAADPAVRDFDGDGQPGATIVIEAPILQRAEVYVVQRAHTLLAGTVDEEGVHGGVITLELHQRTLGASHWALDASPTIRPLDTESAFRMVRTDATGC